ncbi:MAG: L,D-transpeptidase/peptidoglycan binding protein [Lachnospiraceae bacterium]|jgi:lipoprotein-anchoring transpeptidase ErfK/SrfK|nr:L,D-transpeptidase/peptidoglycan binding protein [Lachnospiraceae bacterium]
MKQRYSDAAARTKAADSADSVEYDDYAPVFQKIMPDAGTSADQKLDDAIRRIVDETVGDIPSPKKGGPIMNAASSGRKKHTGLKIFGLVLILVIAALATTYCVFAYQYRTKFLDGTIINGIDASEKTAAQVEAVIKQQVENYEITLTFRGGATETLSNADVGYEYVSNNGVEKILEQQNTFGWFAGKVLGQKQEYTVDEATTFDQDKAKASLLALPEFQSGNETAPANAYLTPDSDSSFTIVQEVQGNTLKSDTVLQALDEAISGSASSLDISALADAYETPTVTADNTDLTSEKDILNNFLSTSITYQLPQGDQTLDYNTTKDWITKQDNGFYYVDQTNLTNQVTEYVKQMAAATDTLKKTRSFKSTARGTVELACTAYGWTIDQASEVTQTLDDFTNHSQVSREPAWSQHDSEKDPQFGGTYIEVDITNQHVYYYENYKLVLDSDCVTGLASDSSRATPKGIFSVLDKEENRTLRGPLQEDGTYQWESQVQYWMHFYGGCGLHDASWRSDFGGSIYKTDGSHGCVNLPASFAAALYDKAATGIPVIVF